MRRRNILLLCLQFYGACLKDPASAMPIMELCEAGLDSNLCIEINGSPHRPDSGLLLLSQDPASA